MSFLAYVMMLAATGVSAFGVLELKRGSHGKALRHLVRSKRLLLGVLFYGVSIPFYLTALRLLPLSVAYPMTSLTYVWSALLAARYLRERVTPARWMGIAMIIVGIVLVSA